MLETAWIDVIFLFLIGYAAYVGRKCGVLVETIKLIFVISATILATHYYSWLGSFLDEFLDFPGDENHMIAFFGISCIVMFMAFLAKDGWVLILNFHLSERVKKVGGFCLGLLNGLLIVGLLFYGILIPASDSKRQYLMKSNLGKLWSTISITMYQRSYQMLIGRLFNEEVNAAAIDPRQWSIEEK